MQSYLTYIIIALAVGYVVWKVVRQIRGKGDACGCGESGTCPQCQKGCEGCPLCDSCNMKEKNAKPAE